MRARMGEGALKPGWRTVRFGDVVRLSTKRLSDPATAGIERYVGLEHIEPGDLRIRRWGLVADGTTFTTRFRPGQVLFGKRRAYQRKVAVADFEGVCSGDIYVLEPSNGELLPELLPFVCQADAFFEHAVGTSAGSLSPRTNWESLAKFEFALPTLDEQTRVCEILSAAEEYRQMLREALRSAWAVRSAAYATLVGRVADGVWPSHWRSATLREAAVIENTKRKPINETERALIPGPFPYYGPTGQLDSLCEYRLEGTYALIGEDGDHFLKYGKWSMTQLVHGKFNVNNHAHVIRGGDGCLTEWFFHYYRHRDVRDWLAKQGAGRLKLKKADLERMPILLPPVEEQHEIIGELNQVVAASYGLEQRLRDCTGLQRSLRIEALGS
jgi:type I restriction enzyme, S subunit